VRQDAAQGEARRRSTEGSTRSLKNSPFTVIFFHALSLGSTEIVRIVRART
jgi:hypothetical protein